MNKDNKLALATLALLTSTMMPGESEAVTSVDVGGAGGAFTYDQTASFVKETFVFNMSASVGLNTTENASIIAIGTIHSDGQYGYTGSSEGGSVDSCGDKLAPTDTKTVPTPSLTATGGCSSS